MIDWGAAFELAEVPGELAVINEHRRIVKRALRVAGVPDKLVTSIETRALRSARRQTGAFQSNRQSRWQLQPEDPQYGTEIDCKVILLRLFGMMLAFDDPPEVDPVVRSLLERCYMGRTLEGASYRDDLLLERMDYGHFVDEAENPRHGVSNFHIGHIDPTIHPKHIPENITWRSHRSNLIQGDMTLRMARIYIIRLIARYFELGEVEIE